MKCHEAHLLVIRAQDTQLAWSERVALRLHLLICAACTAFERQLLLLRAACRGFPGDSD